MKFFKIFGKNNPIEEILQLKGFDELNKEHESRLILSENISKRLRTILSTTNLKYLCQGELKPYIYRRITIASGTSPIFDKARSNRWDCDFDKVICSNGLNFEKNQRATIRVLFEGGESWNDGLIELIPENIYHGNFDAVEYFFQKITKYLNKHEK